MSSMRPSDSRSTESSAAPASTSTIGLLAVALAVTFSLCIARLQRAVMGAVEAAGETQKRIDHIRKALDHTPAADPALASEVRAVERRLKDLQVALSGDGVLARRNFPTPASLSDPVSAIVSAQFTTTSAVTGNSRQAYDIAADEFGAVLDALRQLIETDLKRVEAGMEAAGAPCRPGRVPVWKK